MHDEQCVHAGYDQLAGEGSYCMNRKDFFLFVITALLQVNAWTTSRVQRSLLSLFCRQEAVLPNFWVGSLTHDSVNSALETGINAEEIISYLEVGLQPFQH